MKQKKKLKAPVGEPVESPAVIGETLKESLKGKS